MKTVNILFAKISCPMCGQFVMAEIKLGIGDTLQEHHYTIGDRIAWRRKVLVQDGGRPGNGNIDAEGFAYSPDCGHSARVSVSIRGDSIKDVFSIPEEISEEQAAMPPALHQPALAVDIPDKTQRLPGQGRISFEFDPQWLTGPRKKIIAELAGRGVDIYSPNPNAGKDEFRLMVPHGLHPAAYIEIAYLMAQLLDDDFREPLVEFVDSYPQGVKYRKKIDE